MAAHLIEPPREEVFGERETIADVARNLERWVYGAVVRTYAQARLEAFAAAAPRLRVVNALTDEEHPCQALADCLTLSEKLGDLPGRTIAFVGDGNNVVTSLAQAALLLGINVRVASPRGFELNPRLRERIESRARLGARLTLTTDPVAAVHDADAVYTDVWTSMGQEAEAAGRHQVFGAYQVNAALMAHAAPRRALHALPARPSRRRGHVRSPRQRSLGRLRSGREPPAHAEGAPGDVGVEASSFQLSASSPRRGLKAPPYK